MRIEAELVEACRRGDTSAFESLVRQTQRAVYSLVFRIVGNHDDAADVTQEVYLKIWRSLSGYRGEADLGTWMYRVASNAAISHLRRRGRLAEPLDPERMGSIRPVADPAQERVDADEVERALDRIPASYRTVLVLKEMYEYSIEEIAKQMGVTSGAVKVRLFRARNRLAQELSSDGVVVQMRRRKAT